MRWLVIILIIAVLSSTGAFAQSASFDIHGSNLEEEIISFLQSESLENQFLDQARAALRANEASALDTSIRHQFDATIDVVVFNSKQFKFHVQSQNGQDLRTIEPAVSGGSPRTDRLLIMTTSLSGSSVTRIEADVAITDSGDTQTFEITGPNIQFTTEIPASTAPSAPSTPVAPGVAASAPAAALPITPAAAPGTTPPDHTDFDDFSLQSGMETSITNRMKSQEALEAFQFIVGNLKKDDFRVEVFDNEVIIIEKNPKRTHPVTITIRKDGTILHQNSGGAREIYKVSGSTLRVHIPTGLGAIAHPQSVLGDYFAGARLQTIASSDRSPASISKPGGRVISSFHELIQSLSGREQEKAALAQIRDIFRIDVESEFIIVQGGPSQDLIVWNNGAEYRIIQGTNNRVEFGGVTYLLQGNKAVAENTGQAYRFVRYDDIGSIGRGVESTLTIDEDGNRLHRVRDEFANALLGYLEHNPDASLRFFEDEMVSTVIDRDDEEGFAFFGEGGVVLEEFTDEDDFSQDDDLLTIIQFTGNEEEGFTRRVLAREVDREEFDELLNNGIINVGNAQAQEAELRNRRVVFASAFPAMQGAARRQGFDFDLTDLNNEDVLGFQTQTVFTGKGDTTVVLLSFSSEEVIGTTSHITTVQSVKTPTGTHSRTLIGEGSLLAGVAVIDQTQPYREVTSQVDPRTGKDLVTGWKRFRAAKTGESLDDRKRITNGLERKGLPDDTLKGIANGISTYTFQADGKTQTIDFVRLAGENQGLLGFKTSDGKIVFTERNDNDEFTLVIRNRNSKGEINDERVKLKTGFSLSDKQKKANKDLMKKAWDSLDADTKKVIRETLDDEDRQAIARGDLDPDDFIEVFGEVISDLHKNYVEEQRGYPLGIFGELGRLYDQNRLGQLFIGVVQRIFGGYEQFKGINQYSTFFIDDEDLAKRRAQIDERFCDAGIGGTDCWVSDLCTKYYDFVPGPSEGTIVDVGRNGEFRFVAHVEGERSEPLIRFNDTSKEDFTEFNYRFTYIVRNPSENTIKYNVELVTPEGNRVPWFAPNDSSRIISAGGSVSRTATSAEVKNSRRLYESVCLTFDPALKLPASEKSIGEFCKPFASFNGVATSVTGQTLSPASPTPSGANQTVPPSAEFPPGGLI